MPLVQQWIVFDDFEPSSIANKNESGGGSGGGELDPSLSELETRPRFFFGRNVTCDRSTGDDVFGGERHPH